MPTQVEGSGPLGSSGAPRGDLPPQDSKLTGSYPAALSSGADSEKQPTLAGEGNPELSADRHGADDRPLCEEFHLANDTRHIADATLIELSGVVASRSMPGMFWAHQDSGASAELHLIDAQGERRMTVHLAEATAVDWEDIAMIDAGALDTGKEPGITTSRLVVADIGDNLSRRNDLALYIFDEPAAITGPTLEVVAHRVALSYPDRPHNAEALLIHVGANELVIVTKVDTATSQIFTAPLDALRGDAVELEEAGQLTLPPSPIPGGLRITAGDVRRDGAALLLRTYVNAYQWSLAPTQTVAQALAAAPCSVPLAFETQGESIAYTYEGDGYLTLSEGARPSMWHFEAKRP